MTCAKISKIHPDPRPPMRFFLGTLSVFRSFTILEGSRAGFAKRLPCRRSIMTVVKRDA